jgi:hypothetical protein
VGADIRRPPRSAERDEPDAATALWLDGNPADGLSAGGCQVASETISVDVVSAAHEYRAGGSDTPSARWPQVDVRGLEFTAPGPGDHAYRIGAFRWALAEGIWGLIRVRDTA